MSDHRQKPALSGVAILLIVLLLWYVFFPGSIVLTGMLLTIIMVSIVALAIGCLLFFILPGFIPFIIAGVMAFWGLLAIVLFPILLPLLLPLIILLVIIGVLRKKA